MAEIKIAKLKKLLAEFGEETICPDQLKELIEKASKETVTEKTARQILQPPPTQIDILGPNEVIKALADKGLKIKLTKKEKEKAQEIPFSKEILKMVAERKWRGKRAILFYAPDERFQITMLKLRKLFGTNPKSQPCVYDNGWWLKEDFAQEVLPSGWHLIMAEVADEFRNKNYQKQKELMTKDEKLVKPVEIMLLTLINYQINDGERLFENAYVRTDTRDSGGVVVSLGSFCSSGLDVSSWYPECRYSDLGLALSWKLN